MSSVLYLIGAICFLLVAVGVTAIPALGWIGLLFVALGLAIGNRWPIGKAG